MFYDLVDKLKKGSRLEKVKAFLILFMFAAISVAFIGWMCGSVTKSVLRGDRISFYYTFNNSTTLSVFIVFSIITLIIYIFFILRRSVRNSAEREADDRGLHYTKKGTFGTTRFMEDENKIKERFQIGRAEDIDTTIYGKLSEDNNKIVAWKKPPKGQPSGNKNNLIMATSGSGKSYVFVRTQLLQVIKNGNQSFVVNDPSGDIYTDMANICRQHGMEVKVLNTADINHSDFWNCLEETIDDETERLHNQRFMDFCSIYMNNSEAKELNFFDKNSLNLAYTVMAFTAYQREKYILVAYCNLYLELVEDPKNAGYCEFKKKCDTEFVSFKWCRDEIRRVAFEKEYDQDVLEEIFDGIKKAANYANPYTIKQFYHNLANFDTIEPQVAEVPDYHPASKAYTIYTASGKADVRGSAKQGALLAFNNLITNEVAENLSKDGIHIKDVNRKKCAYFVISDQNVAMRPILTIFFTYLFQDVAKIHDEEEAKAQEKGIKNPCKPVTVILDEFASLGVIGVSPVVFPNEVMAQTRKRDMRISIIIQNYSQIESIYGPTNRDTIMSNCETTVFLGANDLASMKYISEFVGETTVLDEQHEEPNHLMVTPKQVNRFKGSERQLLTVGEVRRFGDDGKILIIRHKCQPLKLLPYPWIAHPLAKESVKRSVKSDIADIHERTKVYRTKYYDEQNETERRVEELIGKLKQPLMDERTGEIIENKPKRRTIGGNKKAEEPVKPANEVKKTEKKPTKTKNINSKGLESIFSGTDEELPENNGNDKNYPNSIRQ